MWHTHNKKNEKNKIYNTHTIKKMKKNNIQHTQYKKIKTKINI